MAGHSKWAKLKHTKGAVDTKRGALWSKLLKEIGVAARLGGPDPGGNSRLRLALDKARAKSVPRDNIERAVLRASTDANGETYENLTYDAYAPGGVAVFISCLTDNRARTISDVKENVAKGGGTLGTAGSVAYLFSQRGVFTVTGPFDEDTVLAAALEGGADDVKDEGDGSFSVSCGFESYAACRTALEALPKATVEGEITYVADTQVAVTDVTIAKQLMKLIDRIEGVDDVQEVYTNAEFSDDVMAELS